jgi:hypothetical protein
VAPEECLIDTTERIVGEPDKDFNSPEPTTSEERAVRPIRAVGSREVNPGALNESQLLTAQMMRLYEDCVSVSSWQPVEELVRRHFADAHWVRSCLLVIELASSPPLVPLLPDLTPVVLESHT